MTGNFTDEQITIDIPGNLLAQIDAQVGSEYVDRPDFIRAAVRHYLEYIQEKSNSTIQTG